MIGGKKASWWRSPVFDPALPDPSWWPASPSNLARARHMADLPSDVSNKKMVAGILGILLGGLGVHKFYLGNTQTGIIQLILGFCCVGGIIGLIEGIIYLTKSDQDFYQTYIVEKKQWF
jgi:TM2 domain-containing membrane protein YozV